MKSAPKTIVVIPARYGSTRFPGKPLVEINGKSMVLRVCEQAQRVNSVNRVVVATDNELIRNNVEKGGFEVVMTSESHVSGTGRCAEAVMKLEEKFDVVINVQGDEPFIAPELIEEVVNAFTEQVKIVTAVKKITDLKVLNNPNVVKAVLSESNNALYFSRQAIPYNRDANFSDWLNHSTYYKHIGIYGFKSETLQQLVKLPEGSLENSEKLEQLRWLSNDFKIKAIITDHESIGIDTPEDLKRFC